MFMLIISTAPRNEGSLKTEDAKVQYREKADIKAKLEEARQRRLALENSRYGDMETWSIPLTHAYSHSE